MNEAVIARFLARAVAWLGRLRRRIMPSHIAAIELATSSWIPFATAAFCELGLPQALQSGARTPHGLSEQGYGDERSLRRLLRALSGYDVVVDLGNDRFALGHIGRALVPGKSSAAGMVRYANAKWHLEAWTNLARGIRHGEVPFQIAHGSSFFAYLQQHPDAGKLFDDAMNAVVQIHTDAVAAAYDFSGASHIVDVGGGNGVLLEAIAKRYPRTRATLFERREVVTHASGPFAIAAGDFFTDALPAADVYLLSHVLHDWDDESCVRLLQNLRRAMPAGARVLAVETVVGPERNVWSQDKITDLEMLATLTGRERTLEEFDTLFARSGLRFERLIPTPAAESIIEATRSDSHD